MIIVLIIPWSLDSENSKVATLESWTDLKCAMHDDSYRASTNPLLLKSTLGLKALVQDDQPWTHHRYKQIKLAGYGAHSSVFLAEDTLTASLVAIKVVKQGLEECTSQFMV